jgi:hypothetical protein
LAVGDLVTTCAQQIMLTAVAASTFMSSSGSFRSSYQLTGWAS